MMAYHYQANARQSTTLFPSMLYLLIVANSMGPIVRAFASGNNSLLAFIIFIFSSLFLLEYSFTIYQRFPQNENPLQKKLISVAIWFLFSGIMFSIAYLFASHLYLVFDIILYGVAFVASAVIFYVYLIYDNNQYSNQSCGTDERVVFSQVYFDIVLEKV